MRACGCLAYHCYATIAIASESEFRQPSTCVVLNIQILLSGLHREKTTNEFERAGPDVIATERHVEH